jgi:hypothetical protein
MTTEGLKEALAVKEQGVLLDCGMRTSRAFYLHNATKKISDASVFVALKA